jgi:hypothetical protein
VHRIPSIHASTPPSSTLQGVMVMGLEDDPDDNANARRVLHDVVFVAQQPTNETELAATANDPRSVISSSLPPELYPFPSDSSLADTNIDNDASARNFDARLNQLPNVTQLSKAERVRLFSEVKTLLGEESSPSSGCSGVRGYVGPGLVHEKSDEEESLLALSSSCGCSHDPTLFTNNVFTAYYTVDAETLYTADTRTMYTADSRTQFITDTSAFMSDVDSQHHHHSKGAVGGRRGRDSDSSFHDDVDYDDCILGAIVGACDPFISFVMCDDAEAGEIENSERRYRNVVEKHYEARWQTEKKGRQAGRAEHVEDNLHVGACGDTHSCSCGSQFSNSEYTTLEQSSEDSHLTDPHGDPALESIEVKIAVVDVDNDDDGAAVISYKPMLLGRGKTFTLQRLRSPFTRVKPSMSETISTSDEAQADVAGRDGATICSDASSVTNMSGSCITQKKPVWWKFTDVRCGKQYYSNGLISMWEMPVDVEIISVSPILPMFHVKEHVWRWRSLSVMNLLALGKRLSCPARRARPTTHGQ